ncbi:MAG: hypothetical protein AB9Q20_10740 [Candidatus Reddybacter sp.]
MVKWLTVPSGVPNQSLGNALSDDCPKICQIDVLAGSIVVDIAIGAIPQAKAAQILGKAVLSTGSTASIAVSLASCVQKGENKQCQK